MHLNQLALVPDSYAAIDTATGERFEFVEAAERLRWRWNRLAPSEPRMPRHCYVVLVGLTAEETRAARVLEFVIEKHPAAYDAYFRLYQWASRYLEPGDGFRYWRSRIGERPFVNRALPEDSEPVRRVDEGAKPIPRDQWHAEVRPLPAGRWLRRVDMGSRRVGLERRRVTGPPPEPNLFELDASSAASGIPLIRRASVVGPPSTGGEILPGAQAWATT